MGAVLAMINSLSWRHLVPFGLALAISGCTNGDAPPLTQVAQALVTQITSGPAEAPDIRTQLTPDVVASVDRPFLLVSLPARDAEAIVPLVTRTGNRSDWRTADGTSVVLDGDILIATRGLGADLFLAQFGDLPAALERGAGTITRQHQRLDGENHPVTTSYRCEIIDNGLETINAITQDIVTRNLTEHCESDTPMAEDFTNQYWISVADGEIWQLKQWVSPAVGYIILQYVKR